MSSVFGRTSSERIVIVNNGTLPQKPLNRTPSYVPIECSYDADIGIVNALFCRNLGNVEVVITNWTTGDCVSIMLQNTLSHTIPCPGNEGYCTITFTLPNGRQYIGEFEL